MLSWLERLDRHFPVRYAAWLACLVGLMLSTFTWVAFDKGGALALGCLLLTALGWRDARQPRHSILRNYPVIGHLRFLLDFVRPEIRQYFIDSDREAVPFSRQQRSLVEQRAKGDADKRPFGIQLDVSPARHSEFETPLQLLQFIERLRELSGSKPTGFKLCIGHPWEWFAICKAMLDTGIMPDFIVVDGTEGGTGATPLEFTDHVGAPQQGACCWCTTH